jgi:hypothetical protein
LLDSNFNAEAEPSILIGRGFFIFTTKSNNMASVLICKAQPGNVFIEFPNVGKPYYIRVQPLVKEGFPTKRCDEVIHQSYIKRGYPFSETRRQELRKPIIKKFNVPATMELVVNALEKYFSNLKK